MPIYHYDIEQYSDSWERIRLGKVTSSQMFRILSPTGKKSAQRFDYAYNLLAEIRLKRRVDTYISPHMERGKEVEPEAANWYEMTRKVDTKTCGFIEMDNKRVGCSPDRLVGNDGILEIKCSKPNTVIDFLVNDSLGDDYKPQIQSMLYISEREWVESLNYHPEMLDDCMISPKIYRDDVYCRLLEQSLKEFHEYMGECIIKIQQKIPDFFDVKPDGIDKLLDNHSRVKVCI